MIKIQEHAFQHILNKLERTFLDLYHEFIFCLFEKKNKAQFFQHSQIYHMDDLQQVLKIDPEQVYQCFLKKIIA